MKKILNLLKKKDKKIEYEIVKSRSGLPIFVLPLPKGIDFTTDEPKGLITKGEEE